jgi:aryl-alcohol dehydrogenase-like predicted oxidoreductase
VSDLCFAYIRSLPWITSVVVGCETLTQLQQNLDHFLRPKLTDEQCEELERVFPRAPEALLNPSKWTAASAWTAAYAS